MTRVIIQPAGSEGARAHLESTIHHPVPLDDLFEIVSAPDRELLTRLYPGGTAAIWGATPGLIGQHVTKWGRANPGDLVLFGARNRYFLSGLITHKMRSVQVAERLWGVNEADGLTWELIYFLDDLRDIDVSYRQFNAAVGYAPAYIAREFNVLSEEQGQAYIDQVEAERGGEAQLAQAIRLLDANAPLEREVARLVRQEQALLRDALLAGRLSAECGICGRTLPANLLVAAHIKPRSECNEGEKRDIPNIAMLACSLGCDALFERGYVSVVDGKVRAPTLPRDPVDLTDALSSVDGLTCVYWNPSRRRYYQWHHANRVRTR
jgi:hypothetical protein